MKFKLSAILALLFTLPGTLTQQSPHSTVYDAFDLNPLGWSPRPTPGPEYPYGGDLRARRLVRKRDLTNTCAYIEGSPLVCPPNQYCAYNTGLHYMGCCSVDGSGNFLSNCVLSTRCVDQAASSLLIQSLCPSSTLGVPCYFGSATGVCGQSGNYPACITIVLYAGAETYSTLRCGPSTELLTATPSLVPTTTSTTTPITSPTTTSTTPTTSPTTTTTPAPSPSPSPSPSPTPNPTPSHTGSIVGGVVGGVGGIALIVGLVWFIMHRIKLKKREAEYDHDEPEMTGEQWRPK